MAQRWPQDGPRWPQDGYVRLDDTISGLKIADEAKLQENTIDDMIYGLKIADEAKML